MGWVYQVHCSTCSPPGVSGSYREICVNPGILGHGQSRRFRLRLCYVVLDTTLNLLGILTFNVQWNKLWGEQFDTKSVQDGGNAKVASVQF